MVQNLDTVIDFGYGFKYWLDCKCFLLNSLISEYQVSTKDLKPFKVLKKLISLTGFYLKLFGCLPDLDHFLLIFEL